MVHLRSWRAGLGRTRTVEGVHVVASVDREGAEVAPRSRVRLPWYEFNVGLYDDSAVLDSQVGFFNVEPSIANINCHRLVLWLFPSILVLDSKELGIAGRIKASSEIDLAAGLCPLRDDAHPACCRLGLAQHVPRYHFLTVMNTTGKSRRRSVGRCPLRNITSHT